MAIYGKVVGGKAIDVFNTRDAHGLLPEWAADDQAFADKVFPGSILMPDGTENGATDNGDGTYTNPTVVTKPNPLGRDLTSKELLAAALAVSPNAVTAIWKAFPWVDTSLREFDKVAGINFDDAQVPGGTLQTIISLAAQAGLITPQQITDLMTKWVEMYPG